MTRERVGTTRVAAKYSAGGTTADRVVEGVAMMGSASVNRGVPRRATTATPLSLISETRTPEGYRSIPLDRDRATRAGEVIATCWNADLPR
jgi:hypothetical protein